MPVNSTQVGVIDGLLGEIVSAAELLQRGCMSEQQLSNVAERLLRCRDKLVQSIETLLPQGTELKSRKQAASVTVRDSTSTTPAGGPLPPLPGSSRQSPSTLTAGAGAVTSPRTAVPAPPSSQRVAAPQHHDTHEPEQGGTPTRSRSGFQVKKPSSVRVAQVPREVPPPTAAGLQREIAKTISSAVYNVLESVANITQSASAHIFVRVGDEMISIANVAAKINFPPKLVRQGCQGSLAAGVTVSNIALNQRNTAMDTANRQASLLIFPLKRRLDGRGSDATPSGALQLVNKCGGSAAYTEVDENAANIASAMIGEMISKFSGIDWTEAFHDPITQHLMAPFIPKGGPSGRLLHDSDGSVFITAADATRKPLVDVIDTFVPPQLIRRVTLPLTQSNSTPTAVGLGAAPSLREVETYLANLQDCWRKSVEMNVAQSQSERHRTKEMKHLRDELNFHKSKCSKIEEELRLHTLDSGDYQREYTTLKDELDQYLKLKGRIET